MEQSTAVQEYGPDESNGTVNTASITNNLVLCSNSPEHQKRSQPPLVSALKASAEENAASFHFPGHNRGHAAPASLTRLIGIRPYAHDLSSIPELDNLFCRQGPILEAQKEAAKLFGSSETWFLVNGTTCGVQAAIMATCSPGEFLILPRNCHLSAISALVLSGAVPKCIFPDYKNDWDIAAGVTPLQVLNAIQELEFEGKKAAAVFITSPTYHGVCSNLSDISELCHSRKIPLIVDEAHGAHLGFHSKLPSSALQQGADLIVQSTHKYALNLGTCRDHVQRLISGVKYLAATSSTVQQPKDRLFTDHAPFDDIIMSLTPRDAFFASKRKVTVKESIGKVSGELICPFPPGIPVLIPGEFITERAVDYLLNVISKGADISGASDPLLSSIVVCNVVDDNY
ncbi:unnamed protein product [Trifolium pratense]|uniref:Uncharacterized protein n=1 Tax=Trifolium pratense TaxID=57577 RepID=A0ACB0MDS9_TRIPR|nr:unnamed protein product [Trifolium pratense]